MKLKGLIILGNIREEIGDGKCNLSLLCKYAKKPSSKIKSKSVCIKLRGISISEADDLIMLKFLQIERVRFLGLKLRFSPYEVISNAKSPGCLCHEYLKDYIDNCMPIFSADEYIDEKEAKRFNESFMFLRVSSLFFYFKNGNVPMAKFNYNGKLYKDVKVDNKNTLKGLYQRPYSNCYVTIFVKDNEIVVAGYHYNYNKSNG